MCKRDHRDQVGKGVVKVSVFRRQVYGAVKVRYNGVDALFKDAVLFKH